VAFHLKLDTAEEEVQTRTQEKQKQTRITWYTTLVMFIYMELPDQYFSKTLFQSLVC
jgi:hypothetical protein